jgi:hypothetical protein
MPSSGKNPSESIWGTTVFERIGGDKDELERRSDIGFDSVGNDDQLS